MARAALHAYFSELAKSMVLKGVAEALMLGIAASVSGCALAARPVDCSRYIQAETVSALPPKNELRILSANIQGLPYGLDNIDKSKPYPSNRYECLGDIAAGYDLVLVQEDWTGNRELAGAFPHRLSSEPSKSLFKTGSGLTILSRRAFGPTREVPFRDCAGGPELLIPAAVKALGFNPGWIQKYKTQGDCFATKSFRMGALGNLKIVDSHLDAGNTERDSATRARQLIQIGEILPPTDPLLIAFDANLKPDIPEDEQSLSDFIRANNLTVAIRRKTDLILVRDVAVKDPRVVDLTGLSDHNGLTVTIPACPGL
jgi:hypothetical protein